MTTPTTDDLRRLDEADVDACRDPLNQCGKCDVAIAPPRTVCRPCAAEDAPAVFTYGDSWANPGLSICADCAPREDDGSPAEDLTAHTADLEAFDGMTCPDCGQPLWTRDRFEPSPDCRFDGECGVGEDRPCCAPCETANA